MQIHDNAIFDRLPIPNAVCKIGSEEYPVDGIECDYDRHNYGEANHEIENFYRLKSETNLLRSFNDWHEFRTNYNFLYPTYQNKKLPSIKSDGQSMRNKMGAEHRF